MMNVPACWDGESPNGKIPNCKQLCVKGHWILKYHFALDDF